MRRRVGRALVVLGLVIIFVAVIYVLEHANGPGSGPKTFATRRSYDMVKESVHTTFPRAFTIAMVGLGAMIWGKRLLRAERP